MIVDIWKVPLLRIFQIGVSIPRLLFRARKATFEATDDCTSLSKRALRGCKSQSLISYFHISLIDPLGHRERAKSQRTLSARGTMRIPIAFPKGDLLTVVNFLLKICDEPILSFDYRSPRSFSTTIFPIARNIINEVLFVFGQDNLFFSREACLLHRISKIICIVAQSRCQTSLICQGPLPFLVL